MEIALFGHGGHAREVAVQIGKPVTFFVNAEYVDECTRPISRFDPAKYIMMVAVADPKQRESIVESLPKDTKYLTFIHPTALILDKNIKIGEGSFIGVNCVLTTNIEIGKHAILNRAVHVGHDCKIKKYFSAMPGSIVSGNVIIGERVFLGNNSSIIEKLSICSDVKIAAGGIVVKNIQHSGTFGGVPVKCIGNSKPREA